jgi:hypothetical protein
MMSEVAGEEYAAWERGVFGDPYLVWHDGPDFTRLVALAHEDLPAVGRMLAGGVRSGSTVAAAAYEALAGIGLVPDRARDVLRAAVPVAQGAFLVGVAQALHVLTGDESWAEPIMSVLTAPSQFDRLDAAMALAGFTPTAHLVEALAHAVGDREYLVRYHAANTLLRYAGVAQDVSDLAEIFGKITHDDPARWRSAAEQLSAMRAR